MKMNRKYPTIEVKPCKAWRINNPHQFHISLVKRSQVFNGFTLTEDPIFDQIQFKRVLQKNVDNTYQISMYNHLVFKE